MKTHNIKLDINYCDDVLSGRKSFEIRLNDRGYQTGDYISFIPVKNGLKCNHPIMDVTYKITYVLNGKGLNNEYVVFAIKSVGSRCESCKYYNSVADSLCSECKHTHLDKWTPAEY